VQTILEDGTEVKLGNWLGTQRRMHKAGTLSESNKAKLQVYQILLGFLIHFQFFTCLVCVCAMQALVDQGKLSWGLAAAKVDLNADRWEFMYSLLLKYCDQHGHCNVPERCALETAELAIGGGSGYAAGPVSGGTSSTVTTGSTVSEMYDPENNETSSSMRSTSNNTVGDAVPSAGSGASFAEAEATKNGLDGFSVNVVSTENDNDITNSSNNNSSSDGSSSGMNNSTNTCSITSTSTSISAHRNLTATVHTATTFSTSSSSSSSEVVRVGRWLARQRKAWRSGSLPADRLARLEALEEAGLLYRDSFAEDETRWQMHFSALLRFVGTYKHCNVPSGYTVEMGGVAAAAGAAAVVDEAEEEEGGEEGEEKENDDEEKKMEEKEEEEEDEDEDEEVENTTADEEKRGGETAAATNSHPTGNNNNIVLHLGMWLAKQRHLHNTSENGLRPDRASQLQVYAQTPLVVLNFICPSAFRSVDSGFNCYI
jgi:hypothetical protein